MGRGAQFSGTNVCGSDCTILVQRDYCVAKLVDGSAEAAIQRLETQTRFAKANRVCEESVIRASFTELPAELCGR